MINAASSTTANRSMMTYKKEMEIDMKNERKNGATKRITMLIIIP